MFDEPVPTFGRFQVTAALGDGRFGPVYLGIDPQTDQVVVIRTFVERLTAEQQQALLDALQRLCAQPLDHESIATPIASGLEHGVPYLAHSYLPGTSVDEFLRTHGPRPLTEVAVRVTHLAAAIDFAAAADVHHGALSPRDIIFAPQSTGVSGFGLVQAMRAAGVGLNDPTRADDIYALAAMTFELLVGYRFAGGSVREALVPLRGASGVDYEGLVAALEPTLSGNPADWPTSALAFAASLHQSQTSAEQVAPAPRSSGREVGRLSFGADAVESGAMASSTEPPAAPSAPPDAAALSMFPAEARENVAPPSHPVAPSGPVWDESPAPSAFDAPLHVDPALRDPAMYESIADAGAPDHLVADDMAHHYDVVEPPEPTPLSDARFGPELSVHDDVAPVREQPRRPVRAHEPVIYRPPTPAAPAFNTVNSGSGSGWRIVAVGAGLAALILIAVAVWVFQRRTDTSSPSSAGTEISQPAERVDDRQPIAPDDTGNAAAPGAQAAAPAGSPSSPSATRSTPAAAPSPSASAAAAPSAAAPAPEAPPVVEEPSSARRNARARENTVTPPPVDVTPQSPRQSRASASRRAAAGERSTNAARTREERTGAAAAPTARASAPDIAASATGRVLVRSTPAGATVLVDGTPRGQTPAAIRDLSLGSHVIVVTSVGYSPWQQTITLSPDRPSQSFEVSLDGSGGTSSAVPASSGLQIDSRPSGAQVFVDGTAVGVTPVVLPTVSVGTHAIRIEMAGYRPWSTSVAVNSGQRTRVSASLEQ